MRSVNGIIAWKFPNARNLIHWRYEDALADLVLWDANFFGVPKPNLATIQTWNAEYVAAEPRKKRRTPQSLYAELAPNAFTAQQLQKTAKMCLVTLLSDKPELAAQIASELGIVIDPNENDPETLEDRRV